MTVPMRPPRFDAVGFTKAALASGKYSTDDIAAVLEQRGATQYAQELRKAQQGGVRNTGLQVGEGILQGIGRPLVAGVGTVAQKIGEEVDEIRGRGEARPFTEIYGQLKADADNKDTAFRRKHGGTALAANVTGAAVGAVANPMLALGRGTPVVGQLMPSLLSRGGRAVNTAVNAGASGTVVGAVNSDAETLAGRLLDGLKTGALSAGVGGVLGPAMEAGGATVRALTPKPVRDFLARKTTAAGRAVRNTTADVLETVAEHLPEATPGTAVATSQTPALDRVRQSLRTAPRQALEGGARALRTTPGPVNPGAMRLLSRLQAQRMGLDELAQLSEKADAPDMLFEVIGDKGVRDAGQMYILGNRTDPIAKTIKERATGENARIAERIRERTGVGQIDARTLNDTYVATRGPVVGKLNEETRQLAANPDMVRTIAETMADLSDRGVNVWGKAVAKSKDFPRSPLADPENGVPIERMTLGQLRTLRKTLDGLINYGRNPLNTNSAEAMANEQLVTARRMVNAAIKDAGSDAAGRQKVATADELIYDMKRGLEAFQKGEEADAETVAELLRLAGEDGKTNLFQMGRASRLAKAIAGKKDGTAGGVVQNPIEVLTGSPNARMNARAAFRNAADFDATLADAEGVNRRLGTSQKVLGGSPTAMRFADAAEQVAGPVNPMEVLQLATNPQAAITGGLSRLWNPVQRRFLGDEMDAMQPFMLAGGPGQMSRPEAIASLRELEPAITQLMARRAQRTGMASAQLGQQGRGRR